MHAAALVIGLALVGGAVARPTYPARLPNGANVPGVDALGHIDPEGGGANNDFGLDFASAGHEWTANFCAQDSDGDGQTNGQELGDPCCEWVQTSNAVVRWTEGVSHPGDATKTSDPSLWANVTCGAGSGSSSITAGSSADDSATAAGSASSSATAASSASSSASTPTPTPTSSGADVASVSVVTVAAIATAAAFFA